MDPELVGPDPVWECLRSGKGHIYYACLGIMLVTLAVSAGAPPWLDAISFGLACGVFADCWAHQVLH